MLKDALVDIQPARDLLPKAGNLVSGMKRKRSIEVHEGSLHNVVTHIGTAIEFRLIVGVAEIEKAPIFIPEREQRLAGVNILLRFKFIPFGVDIADKSTRRVPHIVGTAVALQIDDSARLHMQPC